MKKIDLNLKISFEKEATIPLTRIEFVPYLDASPLKGYTKLIGVVKDQQGKIIPTQIAMGIKRGKTNMALQYFDLKNLFIATFVVTQGQAYLVEVKEFEDKEDLPIISAWSSVTGVDAPIDSSKIENDCTEEQAREVISYVLESLYTNHHTFKEMITSQTIEDETEYFNRLQNHMFSNYLIYCSTTIYYLIAEKELRITHSNPKLNKLLNKIYNTKNYSNFLQNYIDMICSSSIDDLDELCNNVNIALKQTNVFEELNDNDLISSVYAFATNLKPLN